MRRRRSAASLVGGGLCCCCRAARLTFLCVVTMAAVLMPPPITGFSSDQDERYLPPDTLDLLRDCISHGQRDSELTAVPAADGLSTAYRFDADSRPAQCPDELLHRLETFLRQHEDFTIQFALRQRPSNVGVVFSLGTDQHRLLEVEISGWRGELRLRYARSSRQQHRRTTTELFDLRSGRGLDLSDNRWHAVSIGFSGAGSHVVVHVDCRRVFSRRVSAADFRSSSSSSSASGGDGAEVSPGETSDGERGEGNDETTTLGKSLQLWLGQRSSNESLFKGAIEYVKFVGSADGYQQQCQDANTECPTCSEFHRLQTFVHQLQTSMLQLTDKLALAEQRIAELETCECRRKCRGPTEDTWYRDGDVVSVPDSCTQCVCRSGSVVCVRQQCPELRCTNAVLPEGECCPVCRKHCKFDGIRYEHGQTFSPRRCYTCTCQDGKMKCTHQLRNTCPRLQCARQDQILIPGECCKTCRGADFCATSNSSCHANSSCVNLATRHVCMCNRGFNGNGTHCEDVNECETVGGHHGHHCNSNAECVNIVGSYYCRCLPGYEQVDSYTCREINECQRHSAAVAAGSHTERLCDENAVCVNTVGSFQCVCSQGYTGDGNTCMPVCDEPCRNGGQCVGVGVCRCRHGYMGKRCETDIDECAEGLSTCDRVSTECVNLPGGYYCRCRSGFRPDDTSATVQTVRWDRPDGLLRCLDVDECRGWGGGHACPAETQCRNIVGGYECVCVDPDGCSSAMSCESEGNIYRNGDSWRSVTEQCTTCHCEAGKVVCQPQICDCRRSSLDGGQPDGCCSHCGTMCRHQQQLEKVYYVGETWQYHCQQCHCLADSEVDCRPVDCPRLTCSRTIRDEGDCCPRCSNHGPCFADQSMHSSPTQSRSCIFRGQIVPAYHSWHPDVDPCTMCQCMDGSVCCSYIQNCSSSEDSRTRLLTTQSPLRQTSTTIDSIHLTTNIGIDNTRYNYQRRPIGTDSSDTTHHRRSVRDGFPEATVRRSRADGRSGRAP